jgi:hypothetical protein
MIKIKQFSEHFFVNKLNILSTKLGINLVFIEALLLYSRRVSLKQGTIYMIRILMLFVLMVLLSACAGLNDPYSSDPYGRDPYGSRGYDDYDRDDYYEKRRRDRERYELEQERRRIREEKEQLREERERERNRPPAYSQPPKEDKCPSGWYPSDRKCSDKERKRGCKDMRNSSGTLCVAGR